MTMKNKKGSHVAIVISILLFMGFFVFLYSVLEPKGDIQQNQHALLDLLENRLTDNFLANLTTVTFVVDEAYPLLGDIDCATIDNLEDYNDKNLYVRDRDSFVDFSYDTSYINIANPTSRFFKIYYSEEEFDSANSPNKCELMASHYDIGLIKTNQEIFETKILNYISFYENEYEDLKTQLDISSGKEFYFKFIYNDGTIIAPTERTTYGSVYVEKMNIEYINKKAEKKMGEIEVWVW